MRTIVPNIVLDLLRTMGDVDAGPAGARTDPSTLQTVREGGLRVEAEHAGGGQPGISRTSPPIALDVDKLAEAQRLFATYQTEIAGALLMVALPQSYATEFGAGVLGANARLDSDLVRRIRRTAQFLAVVMQPADNDEHQHQLWDWTYPPPKDVPPPWQWCTTLRSYHNAVRLALIRRREEEEKEEKKKNKEQQSPGEKFATPVTKLLGDHNDPPLNQEDLLGMLLTFSISVFEVLESYDLAWTTDEQDAYLHAWDVIGAYLGIGSPTVVAKLERKYKTVRTDPDGAYLPPGPIIGNQWHGLRPPTVDGTRLLLDQIRDRQWLDPAPEGPFEIRGWSSVRTGRILTRALLTELQAAMPRTFEQVPIAVMRALLPTVVCRRLNLGGSGLLFRALALLPKQSHATERFTRWNGPNRFGAKILHLLANDVTTRATVRFLQNDDYVLPGAGDWS